MTPSKIRVGISLRVVDAKNYNERRDALSQEWIFFLEKLDVFPVLIPNTLSNVKSFLEELEIDGIILSGGDNIGENFERDKTEKQIIEYGLKSEIPIFGVCRGMQVLNKFFGGSIITQNNFNHVEKRHPVLVTNKKFAEYLHKDSMTVNSFHNNTITRECLSKNFEPFAIFNDDKTIEGFLHNELPIIGVMWHPERDPNPDNLVILKTLLENKMFWTN